MWATVLVKVYVMKPVDYVLGQCRQLNFDLFIDDATFGAQGTKQEVRRIVKEGAEMILQMVQEDLEGEVSAPKAAVTATHHDLAVDIRKDLGELGGPDMTATVNLGIDDAGGTARASKGAGAKRRWRFNQAKRRRKRIEAMRKQAGGRVKKLFTTGIAPSIGYGSAVNGMSDAEVAQAQREAGRCLRPWGQGRSLTLTLLLHGDPTCMMANAPIMQWAKEVWYAGITQGTIEGI